MRKFKIDTKVAVVIAVLWFIVVSYITAQTEYQRILADQLADPQGTSTQLENILNVLIVVVSFMPSGFLLSHIHAMRNPKLYSLLNVISVSIVIALALYVPFSWYNFVINFGN